MCTIVMPADYEMLVSHSPTIFSHSPPSSFLSDYRPYRLHHDSFYGGCRSPPNTLSIRNEKEPSSPRRPCLVLRPEDSEDDPTSPTRHKKKVVFADDRGMSLTHVRIMTEPSYVPPLLNLKFLENVTKELSESKVEPWKVKFAQPASDYVDFRRRLDLGNVSLENVIVKEAEECVVGTIKVRNLAFQKEVFVRWSSDNWKTSEDVYCTFVNNNNSIHATTAAYVLYDTFSFKLTLPPKSHRIEFCVCFRCNSDEYWDNNKGLNYVLIKKSTPTMQKSFSADDIININNEISRRLTENPKSIKKYSDAVQAKLDSWSEFASWNHLENNTPYW